MKVSLETFSKIRKFLKKNNDWWESKFNQNYKNEGKNGWNIKRKDNKCPNFQPLKDYIQFLNLQLFDDYGSKQI